MSKITKFTIDKYLRTDEAFHFSQTCLDGGRATPVHSHDFYELLLIETGSATHRINGREENLSVGDLLFVRPSDTHCFHADTQQGCRILSTIFRRSTATHLRTRYAEDFKEKFFWTTSDLPTKLRLIGPQFERAVNVTMALRTSRRSRVRIEQHLLTVMTFVIEEVDTIERTAPEWLVSACRAVNDPNTFGLGVSAFFEAAGRAKEHVSRQSRRFLGMTPTQYVNRVRVQHAAMLLGNTKQPLDVVAHHCGFENISYFHRLFKEHYGATPTQYRRRRHIDPISPDVAK